MKKWCPSQPATNSSQWVFLLLFPRVSHTPALSTAEGSLSRVGFSLVLFLWVPRPSLLRVRVHIQIALNSTPS